MLLAGVKNIREVILFPMNQQAQDLMMNAPAEVSDISMKELSLKKDIQEINTINLSSEKLKIGQLNFINE